MSEPMALIANRYRLQHVVGRGGMGVVWQALDERLERRVALKQLARQSGVSAREAELANKRAMREARITARLSHPHAVPVFDVVEQEGQLWLIMQFIPSITLAAVLEEAGPLQPGEAALVGADVASALAAAHAVGIVHRDVKPRNILIADDGKALISDFGIAHALGDATLTTRGMIHGTPAYLAPEVARGGEADFASDVFSLGATLYSAMEGTPPFGTDENSMALLHRVASGQYPPPQHSGVVTPVILDMLSTDPEARPSMRTVADSLARVATETRSSAGSETPPMPAPLPMPAPAEAKAGDAVDVGLSKAAASPSSVTSLGPDSPDQAAVAPQHRRGLAAALAIVAVLGVGILIAVLMADRAGSPAANSGQSSAAAPASASLSSAPQAPSASTKAQPSSTATSRTGARTPARDAAPPASQRTSARPPAGDASSPATPRTQARKSSQPQATTRPPTVRGTPTAGQLRRAITSYYALMPGDTDAAWPRMTTWYQTNHAGGRQAYERFWDAIDRVSVTNVSGIPPSSARATITYYFEDGRVVRERTAYRLVNEGGRLKISRTTVLSSVTL